MDNRIFIYVCVCVNGNYERLLACVYLKVCINSGKLFILTSKAQAVRVDHHRANYSVRVHPVFFKHF